MSSVEWILHFEFRPARALLSIDSASAKSTPTSAESTQKDTLRIREKNIAEKTYLMILDCQNGFRFLAFLVFSLNDSLLGFLYDFKIIIEILNQMELINLYHNKIEFTLYF